MLKTTVAHIVVFLPYVDNFGECPFVGERPPELKFHPPHNKALKILSRNGTRNYGGRSCNGFQECS